MTQQPVAQFENRLSDPSVADEQAYPHDHAAEHGHSHEHVEGQEHGHTHELLENAGEFRQISIRTRRVH